MAIPLTANEENKTEMGRPVAISIMPSCNIFFLTDFSVDDCYFERTTLTGKGLITHVLDMRNKLFFD